MIIIKLRGGLGNQLFEYCFARSITADLNEELLIDVSEFNQNLPRHILYGLHPFNIKGVVGNYPPVSSYNIIKIFFNLFDKFKNSKIIRYPTLNRIINFIINKSENCLFNYIKRNQNFYFVEPNIFENYLPTEETFSSLENIEKDAYIDGFFQFYCDSKSRIFITERFFKKHNNLIHEDLQYLIPLTDESQNIANEMNQCDSILLHVRHGDYTGLLDFGLCSIEYYEKSIELMASKLKNPKFFIFSDDIEGAKKNLKIDYPHVFVDFDENLELVGRGNGELLKIMSSCKHFIIANSTLSWWAAFLSENKDKIIITPQPWFQSRRILGVETIDGKKPIEIDNNNSKIYNETQNLLYKLNEKDFLFKNLRYDKIGESYKIKQIKNNSDITLKDSKKNYYEKLIIKLSIESNCFNYISIYFKTKDKNKYCKENSMKIYYYEKDNFEQYLILPKNTLLDGLKIKPGNPFDCENDYVTINSLEIKEIE